MLAFRTETVLPAGMLQACVAQFYPHVDQITIVEGATRALDPAKFDGDASEHTIDGGSNDGTLEALFRLPDPDKKIEIVTAKGFWNGKTAMANESAKRAVGDYLWEISSDEFYRTWDILQIKKMLMRDSPDAVHFYAHHFVGDCNHEIDEETGVRWGNDIPWARIHRNVPGSHWVSHEPPLYQHPDGLICDNGNLITREMTLEMGVRLFHYGYVARSQALFKAKFYQRPEYVQMWDDFQTNKNTLWINGTKARRYFGPHPEEADNLFNDPLLNSD